MPRPTIDLNNPYVLEQTGANIDKATGLPFKDVGLTEAQQTQTKENLNVPDITVDNEPTSGSNNLAKSGGIYDWVLQQLAALKITAGIEVTTPPTKRIYQSGDLLDFSGLTVVATFPDGTTDDVTSDCEYSLNPGSALSGNEPVTINVEYRLARTSFHVFVSTPYIDLHSASAITLATHNGAKNWDGTLEYSTDTSVWSVWDGATTLSSAVHDGEHHLYLRGTGNTKIVGTADARRWVLTGSDIECDGDIAMLLDYQSPDTVTMADGCFEYLFYHCSGLVKAPQLSPLIIPNQGYNSMFDGTGLQETPLLPAKTIGTSGCMYMFRGVTTLLSACDIEATTLGMQACQSMFSGCTRLQTTPAIRATTLGRYSMSGMFFGCTSLTALPELSTLSLADHCYYTMFKNCTNIKVSETATGAYQYPFRVPTNGTGTTATDALTDMFASTGGTFTGTPTINTTYYTDHEPVA